MPDIVLSNLHELLNPQNKHNVVTPILQVRKLSYKEIRCTYLDTRNNSFFVLHLSGTVQIHLYLLGTEVNTKKNNIWPESSKTKKLNIEMPPIYWLDLSGHFSHCWKAHCFHLYEPGMLFFPFKLNGLLVTGYILHHCAPPKDYQEHTSS